MQRNFWWTVIGVTIGLGVAGMIFFVLLADAWARWGFLGTFLALAALTLLGGWLIDRRNSKIPSDDGSW